MWYFIFQKHHLHVFPLFEQLKKGWLRGQPFFALLITVVCIEVLLVRFVEHVVQCCLQRIGFA